MAVLQTSPEPRLYEYTCTICKMVQLQDEAPERIQTRTAMDDPEGSLTDPIHVPICEICSESFPNLVEVIRA